MKHMFLPLPIDIVRKTLEDWRASNTGENEGGDVRLVETKGGCFLVTSTGRPPRVFVELLKSFLAQKAPLARAS